MPRLGELLEGCGLTGLPKPAGGWLPFVGVRLDGICGGLPKLDGGGVLLKPLGVGGGMKLGAGGGVKPLGAVLAAGGGWDSLDGAVLGAVLGAGLGAGLGADAEGSPVGAGADGSTPGP